MYKCKLCKCEPNQSLSLADPGFRYNCDSHDCPIAESGLTLTREQWTALMGVDHPAIADPVDDHAAMRERQHIMITSQGWDRAQGTAFADGWTQCAYHYGIRQNKKIGAQQ